MGFTWTQPITAGSLASAAALQEIRSNLDYIDNNLACFTANGTYNSTDDGSIYSYHNYSQDSTANGTVYSYNDTSIKDGANATVNTTNRTDVW